MSKLRTRLALTVVGAALLLSALVLLDQHEAAASETLPSREPAAVPGAPPVHNPSNRAWVDPLNSPQEQSAKPIATVQSLASTEPQVPVGALRTSAIAPVSDVRPAEAPAATAAPPTPARRDPATTEVAAYIDRARAKIQQGDMPPRAGCLSEPQTVPRLRLGLRWPKPTNRRCWLAGGSLRQAGPRKGPDLVPEG